MKACFIELARQNIEISCHKNILSLSSTKDKVLSYLNSYSKKIKSNDFYIPYSRMDLALYLGVERSALSYELSKLKKEGYIDFEKNHFILK
jgi:Mn-dependent DtxR family transcriptional regulator